MNHRVVLSNGRVLLVEEREHAAGKVATMTTREEEYANDALLDLVELEREQQEAISRVCSSCDDTVDGQGVCHTCQKQTRLPL